MRLSVGNIGQTGDDTQRRRIQKRIDADEIDFSGWAEDIDVSASLSPWLRPSLGDWLNNRIGEFDVLYVYKIDRIARSVKDLCALLDWCDEHGKSLVSIEEGFDLSTPWGRTIAKILAVLAEAELEAIKARVRASREALRAAGRWAGGLVPFGRVAVKDGDGYTLKLDPVYGPVLIEMIRLFMAAKSYAIVTDWLNAGKIPTSADIARIRAGSAQGASRTRLEGDKAKPRGALWAAPAVMRILTSRSLLGEYVRADGTVVRNPDGSPVMLGPPVLTEVEWLQLQEVVNLVKKTQGPRNPSPIRGFLFSDGPGAAEWPHAMYWMKGGDGTVRTRSATTRIRCNGRKSKGLKRCEGHTWPAEDLYALIEAAFKFQVGHLPVQELKAVADDSKMVQVAVLDGRMAQLEAEFKAGRLSAVEYAAHLGKVAAEREVLTRGPDAKPVKRWVDVQDHVEGCPGLACKCPPLTYGKWWDTATVVDRREKLISWGVKVYVSTGGVRFEYGEEFPAPVQMTGLRFDGSRRPPAPGTVSVVVDSDARKAELVTHGGQVTTFPLPMGAQALTLAA
ncbi:recombinase family protein [Streptomyces sp. NPDC056244]|uniref:recombinase family protein n=1 Tax=Streptomyces sp. NPDC056244 TaxID=3345762 RepID=UPI0035D6EE6A